MDNERKSRIAHELLVILGVVALLMLVLRMWPILLLAMLAIIVCALRMLFLRLNTPAAPTPAAPVREQPPDDETSITLRAFGLLQQRITDELAQSYPHARWSWGVSNAVACFRHGYPLIILLSNASGYQNAQVWVSNLQFMGLCYGTPDTQPQTDAAAAESTVSVTAAPNDEDYDEGDTDDGAKPEEKIINYGRLAFDWVDAHMVGLNAGYNEAIAQGLPEMLIPSGDLPHPDSWLDVCEELKRSGFKVADFSDDGIRVNITQ